jgi:hypothetical protein
MPPGFSWREGTMTADERLLLAGELSKGDESRTRPARAAVWDALRGRFVRTIQSPGRWYELTLSPDGRTLAVSQADTSILLYDIPPAAPPSGSPLTNRQLEGLWTDLASRDAGRAWRAHRALIRQPAQALTLLRGRLLPAVSTLPRELLAGMDADTFAVRDAASKDLADALAQGDTQVEYLLRQWLETSSSVEVRSRARRLLQPYRDAPLPIPAAACRAIRAVAVLEQIAWVEAIAVLKKLAGGVPSPLTAEARAALVRLRGR